MESNSVRGSSGELTSIHEPRPSQRRVVLSILCLVKVVMYMAMASNGPLFPKEASRKGLSTTMVGLIIAAPAIFTMASFPVAGFLIRRIGVRTMVLTGMVIHGTSSILFGTAELVESTSFIVHCFAVRIFAAVGIACNLTATNAYIMAEFGDNLGMANGVIEAVVGLGISLGPPIAGVLFDRGGFGLPFYVFGTLMWLTFVVAFYVIEKPERTLPDAPQEATVSYSQLLKMPKVFVLLLTVICLISCITALIPTLEPHLRKYNLSATKLGLIYFACAGLPALMAPFFGWLSGQLIDSTPIQLVGLTGVAIGYALMGPSTLLSSLFGVEETLQLDVAALATIFLSFMSGYISILPSIVKTVLGQGVPDHLPTHGTITGLYATCESAAHVLGPALGGFLVDKFGFSAASDFVVIYVSLVLAIVAGSYIAEKRGRRSDDYELKSLLS